MPIVANIIGPGHGNDKYLIHDQPGHVGYANFIKNTFNVYNIDGSGDYFWGIVSKVNHLSDIYYSNPGMQTLQYHIIPQFKKKSASALRAWFSAAICCFIYGCNDEYHNDIHIENMTCKDSLYLEVWKKKFDASTGNGNSNDGTAACLHGAGVLEPGCREDSYNYITMDSLDSELAVGYPNTVGTFHDQLLVIPLREYSLHGTKSFFPEWKKTFLYLCGDEYNSDEYFDRLKSLSVKQKIMLHLSAASITWKGYMPNALKLAAGIIENILPLPSGMTVSNLHPPVYKEINGVEFFKVEGDFDNKELLSDMLYLGREYDRKYRSTYPLTESAVQNIKGGSSISDFRLKVTTDDKNDSLVTSARVSFIVNDNMNFVPNPAVQINSVADSHFLFNYMVKHVYDQNHIKWIRGVPTFCMYPNLPSELENRCPKYTYISRQGSIILRERIEGLGKEENLEDGLFWGSLNGDGEVQKLINFSSNARTPYANKILYGDSTTFVSATVASKPEHFVRLTDATGNCNMGYILNMRTKHLGDIPALLENGAAGVDISIAPPIKTEHQTMNAYIDFGGSSSYVRYCIGNVYHSNSSPVFVKDNCTLRKCLIEYAQKQDYDSIVNYPDDNTGHQFVSVASVYDSLSPVNNYLPYHEAWMPIVKSLKEYPGICNLSTSHKTDIAKWGSDLTIPHIIFNNILYTLACNAVNSNCDKLFIFPSLPNAEYFQSYMIIWDFAIRDIKNIFPDLNIENVLVRGTARNNGYIFYESIAVSFANSIPAANQLIINIDMGGSTTDMSAIYNDRNCYMNLCGISSIEYPGKDLRTTIFKDIVVNGDAVAERIFIGSLDRRYASYGPPALIPDSGCEDAYKGYILNMLRDWRSEHDNDRFERKVMDILDISRLDSKFGVNDQKIAANFVLRYMILMPVIKDFIHTAIKIAGTLPEENRYDPKMSSIIINFYGGISKGLDTIPLIDRRKLNSKKLMEKYFKAEFEGEYAVCCDLCVSKQNDKQLLIDGLRQIYATLPDLIIPGFMQFNEVDYKMTVDPKYTGIFGREENVHRNALRIPFEARSGDKDMYLDVAASQKANSSIIRDAKSYFENITDPFEELKRFYEDEIYNKLIDNNDGTVNAITALVENFMENASQEMIADINQELSAIVNSSFRKATESYIYPEMMKGAMFMFTLSKMLSKYHGSYHPDHIIITPDDAVDYQFGG